MKLKFFRSLSKVDWSLGVKMRPILFAESKVFGLHAFIAIRDHFFKVNWIQPASNFQHFLCSCFPTIKFKKSLHLPEKSVGPESLKIYKNVKKCILSITTT